MNFGVQVTLFSGDYFKWCSELLLHILLEDRQKRKDDYRFYMPYGYSLGLRISSPGYTKRLCGRLGGEPASPLTPFAAARAGGAAAAIYWSSCCFFKVSILFGHRSEALSLLQMCAFNSTKSSTLSPTFPNSHLGSLPRNLSDAVRGVPVRN